MESSEIVPEYAEDSTRRELRSILSGLQREFSTVAGAAVGLGALLSAACKEEVRAIRDCVFTCLSILDTGAHQTRRRADESCKAKDLRDELGIVARSLRENRQAAESEKENSLQQWEKMSQSLDPHVRDAQAAVVNALVKQEEDTTRAMEELMEQRSSASARAAVLLAEEVLRLTMDTLVRSAALARSGSEPQAIEQLSGDTVSILSNATSRYLAWRERSEAADLNIQAKSADSKAIIMMCASDAVLSNVVQSIRIAYKLRRRQSRVLAALRKLDAGVDIFEATRSAMFRVTS